MATEVTEFAAQDLQFGSPTGAPPLPLRNTSLAIGTVVTLGVDTEIIRILPGEDCRLRFTRGKGTQADPAAADASCMPLKAGVARDFTARTGTKLIFS